jgi:hypothetical protein
MVGEPSHVKQLSLIHVCKIGLNWTSFFVITLKKVTFVIKKLWSHNSVDNNFLHEIVMYTLL